MRYAAAVSMFLCILLFTTAESAHAQAHLANSLLVNLDLSLEASAVAPANIQVRIHGTDRINDTYYASPVDPDEGATVDWQQQLPLVVDSEVPLRLIFHIATTSGEALPAGYAVQWQYALDRSGMQDMAGSAVTIPAGSSGDMDLTVRGAVVAR